jgi:hypothetical protein
VDDIRPKPDPAMLAAGLGLLVAGGVRTIVRTGTPRAHD